MQNCLWISPFCDCWPIQEGLRRLYARPIASIALRLRISLLASLLQLFAFVGHPIGGRTCDLSFRTLFGVYEMSLSALLGVLKFPKSIAFCQQRRTSGRLCIHETLPPMTGIDAFWQGSAIGEVKRPLSRSLDGGPNRLNIMPPSNSFPPDRPIGTDHLGSSQERSG